MNNLSFLEKLLDGADVEWLPLGEVAKLERGKTITAESKTDGNIPVISGGQKPAYYNSEFNREGETITVAGSGAYAGYLMLWDRAIFVSDAFSIKSNVNFLNTKYTYHYLLNNQLRIYNLQKGTGVPHVYPKDLAKIQVPIPCPNDPEKSLKIQAKIVGVLDKFTELTDELTTELAARKKQYNYYRNQLLTFDEGSNVEWLPLGEILSPKGYIRGPFGSALKKSFFVAEGVPLYEQRHAIYDKREFRYFIDNSRAESLKRFTVKPNDIIVSCSGTIGKTSIIKKHDKIGVINQALLILRFDLSKVNIKYIKHYLDCFTNQIVSNSGGAITNIKKRALIEKIQVPIPYPNDPEKSLAEQARIVAILDKFDALTTSIQEGLPREIELRNKQYEYYRNLLLTFPKPKELES